MTVFSVKAGTDLDISKGSSEEDLPGAESWEGKYYRHTQVPAALAAVVL